SRYHRTEEVFRLAVSQVRKVDRSILSFDGAKKARRGSRATFARQDLRPESRLRARYQPVNPLVGDRRVDSDAVELYRVGGIEPAVLFTFDNYRHLIAVYVQLQVARVDTLVESGSDQIRLSYAVPTLPFYRDFHRSQRGKGCLKPHRRTRDLRRRREYLRRVRDGVGGWL